MPGLRRAAGTVLGLRVAGAAMTYAFVIAMARLLSPEDFGILATLMAASLFLSILASAGQQLALLRFLPPLLARGQSSAASALAARAGLTAAAGNLALWVILAGAVMLADTLGQVERGPLLAFGLSIVPLVGVIDFQAHLARAYRLIMLAILPKDVLWRLISMGMALVAAGLSGATPLPLGTVLAILIAVLAGLILAQAAACRRRGLPSLRALRQAMRTTPADDDWRRARGPLWGVSVAAVAFANVDVMLAAALLGPGPAGLYFAANRIAQAPGFLQNSWNVVTGPVLSELHGADRRDALARTAATASLQAFVPTLALALVLAALAGPVLALFGAPFVAAQGVLWLLLAATVMNTVFGPADLVLNMCGQDRAALRISLITTLGGVGLMLGLGLWHGATGIAAGVLIAVSWRKWMFWRTVHHRLGLRVDVLGALWRNPGAQAVPCRPR